MTACRSADQQIRAAPFDGVSSGGVPGARRRCSGRCPCRRPPEERVLLNGACEAFWLIAQALRPRHAVCVHPAFTESEAALRAARVPVTRVMRRRHSRASRCA